MSRAFFESVLDPLVSFLPPELADFHSRATSINVRLWFGDADREHYEAQALRDGTFEVGFHLEHRGAEKNQARADELATHEKVWRKALGRNAELGPFVFGRPANWRRLSEIWDEFDPEEPGYAVETAERLARYIEVIEPLRRAEAGA